MASVDPILDPVFRPLLGLRDRITNPCLQVDLVEVLEVQEIEESRASFFESISYWSSAPMLGRLFSSWSSYSLPRR